MCIKNAAEVVKYLSPERRTVDRQYHDLLREIYENGRTVRPIHGGEARMVPGAQLRFNMANGFPVITERDLSGKLFYGALAEHIAFLHGASTLEELRRWGVPDKWWGPWVTKEKCTLFGLSEGNLGSASYGEVWTKFPTRDGGTFNQVTAVVDQIRRAPFLRTHHITNFYPPEVIGPPGTRRVVVAPCHGDIYINVFPTERELVIQHVQRSADLPVGAAFNFIQYAAFGMILAKALGYTFTELVYHFIDVHIYEIQYSHVEELLAREPMPFPTVRLTKLADDILSFVPEDFVLENYAAHPKMSIPTPI